MYPVDGAMKRIGWFKPFNSIVLIASGHLMRKAATAKPKTTNKVSALESHTIRAETPSTKSLASSWYNSISSIAPSSCQFAIPNCSLTRW